VGGYKGMGADLAVSLDIYFLFERNYVGWVC
jgi:hypothetical protein